MKILAAQIPAGVLLSAALVTVTALPASAQGPPASVVQPGALERAAMELERESRVSVPGERPTDRSRLRYLAATLRDLAGSIR
jgi:hypothetical protein